MKFEWDEAKRRTNIEKHGIDFAEVSPLFDEIVYTFLDTRYDYGEDRHITLGLLSTRVLVVSHTDRYDRNGDLIIRIISARKATRNEEAKFFDETRL